MNSCSNASQVFAHASAGEELPAGLAAHVAGCEACQAALQRGHRFDAELYAGAAALATPAMPDLTADFAALPGRNYSTGVVRVVGTVAAAILTVAVVFAGYQMVTTPVGSLPTPSATPSASPVPSAPAAHRPTPTGAQQPAGDEFEIAVDNRSESPIRVILYQGTSGPSLTVGPCEASTLKYTIDGPFSLRVGDPTIDDSALAAIATSDQLTVDGSIRELVQIAPDGSVTFRPLVGEASLRAAGDC